MKDLALAMRGLLNRPVQVVVFVATFASAGMLTSITFSLVNEILLKPLPFPASSRVADIWAISERSTTREKTHGGFTEPLFRELKEGSLSFEGFAGIFPRPFAVSGTDTSLEVFGATVSHEFFTVLGVQPVLGRSFVEEDDKPGAPKVAILSFSAWQGLWHANEEVLGETVRIGTEDHTIVGVMARDFSYYTRVSLFASAPALPVEIWTPLGGLSGRMSPYTSWLKGVARLKPGVSVDFARQEVNQVIEGSKEPGAQRLLGSYVETHQDSLTQPIRIPLLLVYSSAGFIFLIACVNLANLQFSRAFEGSTDTAIRQALGARGLRSLRPILVELGILLILGCGISLALTALGLKWIPGQLPAWVPRLQEVSIGGSTVIHCLLAAGISGLVCALTVLATNRGQNPLGRSQKLGTGPRTRLLRISIIAEIAIATALLLSAGLMLRSFVGLRAVDPGFSADRLLGVRLAFVGQTFRVHWQVDRFMRSLHRMSIADGRVLSAAYGSHFPFGRGTSGSFRIGEEDPASEGALPAARFQEVSSEFFTLLGIRVLDGRGFSPSDDRGSPLVAVINEECAKRYWQGRNPIGDRVELRDFHQIVGIVNDTKPSGLEAEAEPIIYVPFAQGRSRSGVFFAEVSDDPVSVARLISRAVREIDDAVVVAEATPVDKLISDSISEPRIRALVMSLFAAVGLVLVSAGVYGVQSFLLSQRQREFAVRMSCGADRTDIFTLVLRSSLVNGIAGLLIGVSLYASFSGWVRSMLFEVGPFEPNTILLPTALILASHIGAGLLPTLRACWRAPAEVLHKST